MSKLSVTLQGLYNEVKTAVGNPQTKVSVGDRIQASQQDEYIIGHASHTEQRQMGTDLSVHEHTVDVVIFSKSYTSAATRCDALWDHFKGTDLQGLVLYLYSEDDEVEGELHFFPVSQRLYYTDSDDYAASMAVSAKYIQKQ